MKISASELGIGDFYSRLTRGSGLRGDASSRLKSGGVGGVVQSCMAMCWHQAAVLRGGGRVERVFSLEWACVGLAYLERGLLWEDGAEK